MTKKAAHPRGGCALYARPSRAQGFIAGVGPTTGPRPLGGAALGLGGWVGPPPARFSPDLPKSRRALMDSQEARLPGPPSGPLTARKPPCPHLPRTSSGLLRVAGLPGLVNHQQHPHKPLPSRLSLSRAGLWGAIGTRGSAGIGRQRAASLGDVRLRGVRGGRSRVRRNRLQSIFEHS